MTPLLISKTSTEETMRKSLMVAIVAVLCLLGAVSCKQEIQNMRGLVTNMEIKKDTLISMSVSVEPGDTTVFNLDNARFQAGIVMAGDPVIVDYIEGRNDTMRALIVTLLPKIPSYDEPVTRDTLATFPTDN